MTTRDELLRAEEVDVRSYWKRHNRRAFLLGVGLVLLSALLWLLSFWVLKVFFLVALARWVPDTAWESASGPAYLILAVLLFECLLHGKKLYDRRAYANSVILEGVTDPEQEFVARRVLAAFDWEDSAARELLFLAPRCSARAVEVLTSIVFFKPLVLHRAQAVVENLSQGVEWRGVEHFMPDAQAVVRLVKMGLVQLRVKDGIGELRLTPRVLRPLKDTRDE